METSEPRQRIRGRLVGHGDLEQCRQLLPDWLPLEPRVRDALPRIWTRLLYQSAFNADVIEDLDRPPGERLVGLGMSIALDAHLQRRLREEPPPFAAVHIYRALLDGHFTPPTDAQLGAMNAAGEVVFLVLHYAQRHVDMSDPGTINLLAVAMTLFRDAHAGYRLRCLYQEGVGDELAYLASMGFEACTRRAEQAGRDIGAPGIPELFGLTNERAAGLLPGTPVRDAFQFTPPALGFSASERRLLRLAVSDLPDERIAEELGLTANTIKKLWRSIHQRVNTKLPELYRREHVSEDQTSSEARGPDKRRVLLPYLRQHPEELRPYAN